MTQNTVKFDDYGTDPFTPNTLTSYSHRFAQQVASDAKASRVRAVCLEVLLEVDISVLAFAATSHNSHPMLVYFDFLSLHFYFK